MVRNLLLALGCVAGMTMAAAPAAAQFGTGNSPNNLFSQYYTQPGGSLTQAGMYPAPHHVPSNVGHSYYTYQPLMPHEMMYQHTRNYYNYYNTGGYYGGQDALNRTTVRWQSGTNHMGPMPFSGAAASALKWRYEKNRYCLNGNCTPGIGLRTGRIRGGLRAGDCATGDCGDVGVSYDGGCASGNCGG